MTQATAAQRRKQQEAENVLKAVERPFAKKIYRATKQFYHASLADHLERGGNFTAIFNYYKQRVYQIEKVYVYYSINKFVGTELLYHKSGRIILEQKDAKKKRSYVEAIYQNYMHVYGAQQVRYITDTSRADIQDALSDPDTTRDALTASIDDLVAGMAFRSALIARTETHNAGQYAAIESVKNLAVDSGKTFMKAWVSSQDERTRESHAAMDATNYILLAELFDVGDSQGDRPGDPNLPPEELCNCRCAVIMEEEDYVGGGSNSQDNIEE